MTVGKIVHPFGEKVVVGLECGPGRTKQSHKDECDINLILRKYVKTGIIEHVKEHKGSYGDFASFDFQEAMEKVAEAHQLFETVPAKIRKMFGNDPAAFLAYVQDEGNTDKLIELGLAKKPEVVKPSGSALPAEAGNIGGAGSQEGNEPPGGASS